MLVPDVAACSYALRSLDGVHHPDQSDDCICTEELIRDAEKALLGIPESRHGSISRKCSVVDLRCNGGSREVSPCSPHLPRIPLTLWRQPGAAGLSCVSTRGRSISKEDAGGGARCEQKAYIRRRSRCSSVGSVNSDAWYPSPSPTRQLQETRSRKFQMSPPGVASSEKVPTSDTTRRKRHGCGGYPSSYGLTTTC
mmetsp:Transcript_104665/g.207912  ORF Transcript_104665/g.207912 Transcript_104665/m.207912 type:complete len:196 (+) Transcript_104665:45-632(+)